MQLASSADKCAALQEQVLSLKGAIRVFVRVRPTLPSEIAADAALAATQKEKSSGRSIGKASSGHTTEQSPGGCGPLFQFPDAGDDATAIEVVERPGSGIGGYGVGDSKRSRFAFQRVLPPTSDQAELFADVEGLVLSTLAGGRVCIFAYGQASIAR